MVIEPTTEVAADTPAITEVSVNTSNKISIPPYDGHLSVEVNQNMPFLDKNDGAKEFEIYAPLDELNRCGVAYANISPSTMPNEERGSIGHVRPSGWHTVKFDFIDGLYCYNRCHLIAHCLAGENDNVQNLITGTRQLNVGSATENGMLYYEELVAKYVDRTGNHVLYRVTPYFTDDNLVTDGVLMEGLSIEDDEIQFCVFVYNVQEGVDIDYATGDVVAIRDIQLFDDSTEVVSDNGTDYILNTNSHKIHLPSCDSVNSMAEHNKSFVHCTLQELLDDGYTPCQNCIGK